ncbi:hypothetical protein Ocin01_15785 [Orchesella cincta]|uniref:Uncharacterized protein n=1 Tax=Orchesella cincta TaxID=48709 RepID=A0A1D2MD21_ORCCI|nr:hypothetical protein Ocin01_15785 [Orchesella cincta]
MADDELSDSPAARRGPVLTPLLPPPPQIMIIERQVPSSTATFTTTTGGLTTADTYSPPFTSQSLGPTTATEEEDEKVEDNSESLTVQDEEDDGKTSEKEESKLETEVDEEKEKEDATELEFSEGADIAEKKGESVPPPLPPQVEQIEEKISEAEAVANSPIPTPLSPIEKEEQTENHNDLTPDSKEEKEKPEEKIDTELKEEFPPLSQTSSATQSSQTQTPVSNLDDHGTQTIRFDSSSGGPVSDEERTAGATASHPSSAGGAPPSSAKKRCRPFCVITTPPPPSKINSGTVTTAVPKLSRIIEVQSEQLEHNKAVDDQMAYKTILVPGMIPERLRKLTKRRKKKKGEEEVQDQNQNRVERTISLSKLSEKVCQEIVDETSGQPQVESEKGRPCTSQKIWEQAAMQFQAKVGRYVEQKRRRKSTTDVKLFQELNDEINSNPPEAAENSVKESRSVPNAITEEVSERLKSILKRGTPKKSGKLVNSLLWLRDAEPAPPQFKGRTLPHVASATFDHEILAELKRRLQMLKYQQEDTKIGKLMSSWALTSLDTQLPQLNLQDMMIQPPTVFPEKGEVKHEEKPLPPPVSSPEKRPAAVTKSTPIVPSQMTTTSSFIIAGAPSGIKRNKSHHHLLFKKSIQKVPPPVPPQSPKKRMRKQPIYIAPSMKIPTFTIGPPPKGKGKQAKNSKSKAKIQKTSGPTTPTTATTSKPSSTSTSTRIFVKAKVGKTKITKSPVRASISGFKPRAKSTNSTTTVIQTLTSNRRREMNLADRNTIKKVIFVPTSPSSKLFRSNLRKLSIISKKLDADNSRRGGTGQKGKMNEKKTGSTTTLFRKSEGGKQSLKIVPETVEPVFVGGARPTKKVGGGVGLNSNTKGKSVMNFQLSEADREKLARRVSFSDPIAIVKTVSPTDLNENSAAVQLENMSLVIGPGRNSPRRETKSQFSMN